MEWYALEPIRLKGTGARRHHHYVAAAITKDAAERVSREVTSRAAQFVEPIEQDEAMAPAQDFIEPIGRRIAWEAHVLARFESRWDPKLGASVAEQLFLPLWFYHEIDGKLNQGAEMTRR